MDLFSFLRRKNMTQAELSKRLETTPGNVNRWAKGDGVPSYELCAKLLRLGMTVEELFGVDYAATHQLTPANPSEPDNTPIDYQDPKFLAALEKGMAIIEERKKNRALNRT